MAAANFPNTPTFGDLTLVQDIKYRWNGEKWGVEPQAIVNPIAQSNSGLIDLSKGNHHKIDFSSTNLEVPISFTGIPPGSSKFFLEFTSSFSEETTLFNPSYSFNRTFTGLIDFYFKPDGSKIYVLNSTNDSVDQYLLSTPWTINTSTAEGVNFSIGSQVANPLSLEFKPDGTKMYVLGDDDRIHQYTLSTPWNVSTATYDVVGFNVGNEETLPKGFTFNNDGKYLYVVGTTSDSVVQYELAEFWNVRTAKFLQSFSVSGQEASPNSIKFTGSGNNMYVIGVSGDDVNLYNLSTPWDITTAVFDRLFSVSSQVSSASALVFKSDGTRMYIGQTGTAFQYTTAGTQYFISIMWPNNIIWKNNNPPLITENQKLILEMFTPDGGETIYGIETINIDNT